MQAEPKYCSQGTYLFKIGESTNVESEYGSGSSYHVTDDGDGVLGGAVIFRVMGNENMVDDNKQRH